MAGLQPKSQVPPAVSLPNQGAIEKAASADGLGVEEWLSRSVLASLAADENPPSTQSAKIIKSGAQQGKERSRLSFPGGAGDDLLPPAPGIETPTVAEAASPGTAETDATGMSFAESFGAARLAEILNRAAAAESNKTESPAVVPSAVPLVVVPSGSPPSRLHPNIGRWASGAVLIVLFIMTTWVWVLPALKPPGGGAGAQPDLIAQVPPAPAAKAGKAAAKSGKAAATDAKAGGQKAAVPKAPPRPAIDPSR